MHFLMAAAIPTLRLHTFAMAIVCGPRVWGTRLPHEGCARQQSQLGSSTNIDIYVTRCSSVCWFVT